MSTPNPQNPKVDGLDLYAPRRARAQYEMGDQKQSFASDQERPMAAGQEQPPAADQEQSWADGKPSDGLTGAPENDQPQVPPSGPWKADGEFADPVQARIDQAFDLEREFREIHTAPLPRDPHSMSSPRENRPQMPRAARLASSWNETYDELRPSSDLLSDLQSSDRRIAWLRSRLDPELVPEPSTDTQRRLLSTLTRFSLLIGAAAIAAYGFTVMSPFQGQDAPRQAASVQDASHQVVSDNTAPGAFTAHAEAPISQQPASEPILPTRLVVENQHAFVNEPLPLAVSVAPSTGDESLVVAGLAAGTRLSAGAALNESSWRLRARDLRGLYLYAPKDFVGEMDAAIDVLSSSQRLLDSRSVRLEWVARKEPPAQGIDTRDPATPKIPAAQQIDPQQAEVLMKRGRDALASGDIAAARLAFRRLADAGNAEAALGLGATYDPRYLVSQHVIGVSGDEVQARAWYQRAVQLGSIEAKNILKQMATK